ncbi:PREDICTED: BTB/POZ domain-containing protein At4g08455-like [Prunus mume]|uniref:BTB/POZ domain-containing protein At4g08455-like n=1 Tax=Prunus mume TaxID=102107 RepID=A0ABM0P1U3_PRUMU|nr:PREDICTED: BTB/POZ domain-containing protein At4g08455-like [Prunus mume]
MKMKLHVVEISSLFLFGFEHRNMKCISCEGKYDGDAGACKQCYEDLKAKVAFLTMSNEYPLTSWPDVVLSSLDYGHPDGPVKDTAHTVVLASRSPVFKAILENETKEIDLYELWPQGLGAFVRYLYTAEICLDQQLARSLLGVAKKYQVHHLEDLCQKFLVSNLNWDNSLATYTFGHDHNDKQIIDAALMVITNNLEKLASSREYAELKESHPQLVIEIYERHFASL